MLSLLYLVWMVLSVGLLTALWFVILYFQLALGVVIHELGHLVAALLLKVRVHLFYINTYQLIGGRIVWFRIKGILFLFHNKNKDTGFVMMENRGKPAVNLILALAGPLTNIAWTIGIPTAFFMLELKGVVSYFVFFYIVITSLIQIMIIVSALFGSDGDNAKAALVDMYRETMAPN